MAAPLLQWLSETDTRELSGRPSGLPDLAAPASQLRDAIAHTEEAAAAIRRFVETAESDPERLDEVDERLSVLARLERKYRTDLASLESMRAKVEREIAELRRSSAVIRARSRSRRTSSIA